MRSLIGAAVLATFIACGSDPGPSTAARQPTETTCVTTSTLTYASFGAPFAAAYCTMCHASTLSGPARFSAPAGLDFDAAAGIQAAIERIDRVAAIGPAATNRDMPPGAPRPTDAERRQLAEWLACGAP